MNNPIKADKVTIFLGKEIPLDVYRLPDGSYRLSKSSVAEAIDLKAQYVSNFWNGKSPEANKVKGLTFQKLKVEDSRVTFDSVPLALASQFWRYWDKRGNEKAGAIIDACVDESIERRADAAFGVMRSEEERQAMMQARIEGKETRRQLMDAIKDYLIRHPDLSENRKKFVFINVSQQVDKQVFGRIAAKLAQDLGVSKDSVRDALTPYELLLLREVEDSAMRRIDLHDVDPVDAVRQAAQALLIPVQERKRHQE